MASTTDEDRRAIAQVFTPVSVARFMAARVPQIGSTFTFVDAGAGVGVLAAAICERIATLSSPRRILAELYETDPNVIPLLRQTMEECERALRSAGHQLEATILCEDFVLRGSGSPLYSTTQRSEYADVVMMNPPYAKLAKQSMQARAFSEIVHGQPNVYALFMAAAVELLRPGGELVAITPRSYCNGLYFREFRRWMLSRMSLRHIHVFESRRATFKDAEVLQESVITVATKERTQRPEIVVSASYGAELEDARQQLHAARTIIDDAGGECLIRLPADPTDVAVIRAVEAWGGKFSDRDLRISTGPVVSFRASPYLLDSIEHPEAVPLLSIHNVRPFATVWPVSKGSKPIALKAIDDTKSLLLPARNYVLVRRFSAKEERRRLTASPYIPSKSQRRRPVALENHINYITHATRELTPDEVHGLVAIFNSALFDRYFRIVSGNTQVNATEIRPIPFPDLGTVARIGRQVAGLDPHQREEIESRALRALDTPASLREVVLEGEA